MKLTRFVIYASLPGLVIGLLVTSLFFHGWFCENLHGDFYDQVTGEVHWLFSVEVFFGWFIIVFTVGSVVVAIGLAVFAALRSLFLRFRNRKS